jgi:cardiolipin synthase C
VVTTLVPMVEGMQSELTVISPYFVPGEEVTAAWVKAVGEGRRLRVLTNSLVANDVAAVHGG